MKYPCTLQNHSLPHFAHALSLKEPPFITKILLDGPHVLLRDRIYGMNGLDPVLGVEDLLAAI